LAFVAPYPPLSDLNSDSLRVARQGSERRSSDAGPPRCRHLGCRVEQCVAIPPHSVEEDKVADLVVSPQRGGRGRRFRAIPRSSSDPARTRHRARRQVHLAETLSRKVPHRSAMEQSATPERSDHEMKTPSVSESRGGAGMVHWTISEQFFAEHRVSRGSHPSHRHEEPASLNTCVTLLTGGLLVRIQPEEPISGGIYRSHG